MSQVLFFLVSTPQSHHLMLNCFLIWEWFLLATDTNHPVCSTSFKKYRNLSHIFVLYLTVKKKQYWNTFEIVVKSLCLHFVGLGVCNSIQKLFNFQLPATTSHILPYLKITFLNKKENITNIYNVGLLYMYSKTLRNEESQITFSRKRAILSYFNIYD